MTEPRGPAESLRPSTRSLRSLAQDQELYCTPITSLILSKGRQARVEGRTIFWSEFCETNPIRPFRVGICPANAMRVRKSNSTNQSQFYEWNQRPGLRPSQLESQSKPNSRAATAFRLSA